MLLLYRSGMFLSDMRKNQHLKKYYKRVNSDIVILETILYLHAMLSYSAMDGIHDEDNVLSILNKALIGTLGTVENLATISSVDQLGRARNYIPNVQSSTERFALVLEHSCFGKNPVLKPSIDLKITKVEIHLGLMAHTASFAQVQIPACSEIVDKVVEGDV